MPRGLVLVLALVALVVVALVVVVAWPVEHQLPRPDVALAVAPIAAAGGTAAALLAALAARLTADQRMYWISLALACYSLVAIPTATISALGVGPSAAVDAVRLVVGCVVMAFLLIALAARRPLPRWGGPLAVLCGAALLVGAAAVATVAPDTVGSVTSAGWMWLAEVAVWTVIGAVLAASAVSSQAPGMGQIGLGVTLLGLAHAEVLGAVATPGVEAALLPVVRLAAIALLLRGTLGVALEALSRLDTEHDTQEQELRQAEHRLARAAERDHELRTGLAGIAGATALLAGDHPNTAHLGSALNSELNRLGALLHTSGGPREPRVPTTFAVEPVLSGLVALRGLRLEIRLDVEPGLRATGSSNALAQVMTNLLSNAERHAPGSPVELTVRRRGDRVVFRLRDFGPGLPPGQEPSVFGRGVRDDRAGGSGLGLAICRRLVAAESGSIRILPADPERPGCVVEVQLPIARGAGRVPRSRMLDSSVRVAS